SAARPGHLDGTALPFAGLARLRRRLPRRPAHPRRRLPPGHGLALADRALRRRPPARLQRRGGGPLLPGAARRPPPRCRPRLGVGDRRRLAAAHAAGLSLAGMERRRAAPRLARGDARPAVSAAPAGARPTYRALLRVAGFPALFSASMLGRVANRLWEIALVLFVLERFHS